MASVFESLETRTLFAGVTLIEGTLTITGTNGGDNIKIGYDDSTGVARLAVSMPMRGQSNTWMLNVAEVQRIVILGRGGDDVIEARLGLDTPDQTVVPMLIRGQGGNDRIQAGNGNDTILGGSHRDYIHGYGGDDSILGNNGDDIISSGRGDDEVYGGGGDDMIRTGAGLDRAFGEDGNDTVTSTDGKEGDTDTLDGGAGIDFIRPNEADLFTGFEDKIRNIRCGIDPKPCAI